MPDGKVASFIAGGPDAIRGLVMHLVRPPALIPGTKRIGDADPKVELDDLEGDTVALEEFRGRKTLILFWNPGCSFCQQMLPDLKQWEENTPKGVPSLLVVSAGRRPMRRWGLALLWCWTSSLSSDVLSVRAVHPPLYW
jgi:thiol-disulfide isomerase/thioredoxin